MRRELTAENTLLPASARGPRARNEAPTTDQTRSLASAGPGEVHSIDRRTSHSVTRRRRRRNSGGAERFRGERLRLGIRVSKRTTQKYMRTERDLRLPTPRRPVCPLFAFFIIELRRTDGHPSCEPSRAEREESAVQENPSGVRGHVDFRTAWRPGSRRSDHPSVWSKAN